MLSILNLSLQGRIQDLQSFEMLKFSFENVTKSSSPKIHWRSLYVRHFQFWKWWWWKSDQKSNQKSRSFMKFIFLFIQLLYAQEKNEKQPNIVFVLADYLSWADVNWNNKDSFLQYKLKLTFKWAEM